MAGTTNSNMCVRNAFCAHIKLTAGLIYREQSGGVSSGNMGASHQRRLAHAVTDILPWAEDQWRLYSNGKADWPEWLIHRSRHCLPPPQNDEIKTFKLPRYRASWEAVNKCIASGGKLDLDDIRMIQERQIILDFKDVSGVYVGRNRLDPELVRIGASWDAGIGNRWSQHDATWELVRVFATLGNMARALEKDLQRTIVRDGATPYKRGVGDKSNSFYRLGGKTQDLEAWLARQVLERDPYFFNTAAVQKAFA